MYSTVSTKQSLSTLVITHIPKIRKGLSGLEFRIEDAFVTSPLTRRFDAIALLRNHHKLT